MKRILVATDGSEGSDRAIDGAAAMAKDANADLLIVNVIGGYGAVSPTAYVDDPLLARLGGGLIRSLAFICPACCRART